MFGRKARKQLRANRINRANGNEYTRLLREGERGFLLQITNPYPSGTEEYSIWAEGYADRKAAFDHDFRRSLG